jgi:hypothetical protein
MHGSDKNLKKTRSNHGPDGFHQETVHRHHPVDRDRRWHAGLALPDGRDGNPERRLAHRSRIAGGRLRQRRQGGRRVRPRHVQAHDADAARAHVPEELGQALRVPLQERRLLLQHAPAGRPEVGHAPADHHPRQGLRRRAPAGLRQLQLPHRRCQAVPHRNLRHARHLQRGRPRRPAARPGAAEHQQRHRLQRRALPRPCGQPDPVCAGARRAARARVREDRHQAREHHGAERLAARRAAEDPRPEDRHGHGRQRHGQVHAVPDGAGDSQVRRRRGGRWRHRGRRDGPGRRRGARPGAGAEPRAGPEPERGCRRPRQRSSSPPWPW